uniref:DH domain-containing protein n=1 Tax=Esox lucius TaxID=8010 RepID=A0A3P9AB07_ESOLU
QANAEHPYCILYPYCHFQRKPKQKVVSEYSTVSKGAQGSVKPRPALIQVLFNQGANDKSSIPEVLYSHLTTDTHMHTHAQKCSAIATPVVHSNVSTQRHQQEALWELVHTELTYINKLTIVTDLVMAALINLHQHGFLSEVTPEQLFSNLSSILSAHRLFWQEVIYPMLLEVRRTGKPFDPLVVGFINWSLTEHKQYSRPPRYILNECGHPFRCFSVCPQWLESHPQCERMRLGDMQAKPHQRITKYPLLLKAILKNTQDPHTQNVLRGMLASVNGFLESINSYLRLKDEELALSLSAQKIEGYSTMEGMSEEIDKHVKEFCRFDLTCPVRGVGPGVIRKLLLEETLKIRGRKDNKLEVIALLFSDVLLVTKAQKKAERLKVVHPPLALDRVRCVALKDGCEYVVSGYSPNST